MALIKNEQVITGTVTGGDVTYSEKIPHRYGYSVAISYSGSGITGEAKLQGSNDDVNYVDLDCSTQAFTDDSGVIMFNGVDFRMVYLKIVCTSTTGAVTFAAQLALKRNKFTE